MGVKYEDIGKKLKVSNWWKARKLVIWLPQHQT